MAQTLKQTFLPDINGPKENSSFIISPKIRRMLKNSTLKSAIEPISPDKKVLARNEVIYYSKTFKEIVNEKTARQQNVMKLGFLSNEYSTYKALVLDSEALLVSTLFPPDPANNNDRKITSAALSTNTEQKNEIGPPILIIEDTQLLKRTEYTPSEKGLSDVTERGRFKNGYDILCEKINQAGQQTRAVKLGRKYMETFDNKKREAEIELERKHNEPLPDGKVIDVRNWAFDMQRKKTVQEMFNANSNADPHHELDTKSIATVSVSLENQAERVEIKSKSAAKKLTNSKRLANKINYWTNQFYEQRESLNASLNNKLQSYEDERQANFRRKYKSFEAHYNVDCAVDFSRMRSMARQLKVDEKLKEMKDVSWYDEFIGMLTPKFGNMLLIQTKNYIKPTETLEEKLISKIKSFIENDVPFNKNTFKMVLKSFNSSEFNKETIQRAFRFLKMHAFKLTERDYLNLLEEIGLEETKQPSTNDVTPLSGTRLSLAHQKGSISRNSLNP
ncbi:hypothetical protein O9G_001652 [Rozella allomycis CSF55]|uniref:Uncharacterized protein n=1 Tax=Rozella allomycis (strain CSF55) TaxID=988480 RepID=A0A075AXE4_ROZAC|nr:hypothetical protein O9G_001652 [Rozella allomycis CSF55]|eukprot:EPZ34922.1 hypothetical protein O9G_001652 [Rozella allomycis CSF55]